MFGVGYLHMRGLASLFSRHSALAHLGALSLPAPGSWLRAEALRKGINRPGTLQGEPPRVPLPHLSPRWSCACNAISARARWAGFASFSQEKRRAERAEQQRIRNEREKERQTRLAVSDPSPAPHSLQSSLHGPSPLCLHTLGQSEQCV